MDVTTSEFGRLGEAIGGTVTLPGNDGWDLARQAWNLSADQHPAAVATPANVDDVRAVIDFARENGLRVTPQGTGHGATTVGDLSGSVLLKTTRLTGVEVDPTSRWARALAGAIADDVMSVGAEHGLAGLCGSSPTVGIVGYSLGGGIGWLGRKHGMQVNTVRAVELVTAQGELVRADAENEADLFWALRGGGGGDFGVVTAIEFEMVPLVEIYGGVLAWPWERSEEVLKRWAEWAVDAPEEITTSARILQFPPIPEVPEPLRGRQLVMVDGAYVGAEAEVDETLAPLRELRPEIDTFATIPAAELIRVHGDPEQPVPGVSDHRRLNELPEEAIESLVEVAGPGSGSPLLVAELRQLGGAFAREPQDGGATAMIEDPFLYFALALAMTPEIAEAGEAHAERTTEALQPWASDMCYLNIVERPGDTAMGFSEEAYVRLRGVKADVDPHGLFQSNHAIPAA
jgi:FAD/FMN-containing dehydrogenase